MNRGGEPVSFMVKLCDLGLSVSSTELVERRHDDIHLPETINWTAPELFTGGDQQSAVAMLSTKSDCFALGMVHNISC
jgi:serine/threonine protein kinase